RQSSPLPIVPQRERDPGCASLTRATQAAWHGAGDRRGSGGAGGDGALAGRAAGPPDGQQGGKGAGGSNTGRSPDKAEGRIRGRRTGTTALSRRTCSPVLSLLPCSAGSAEPRVRLPGLRSLPVPLPHGEQRVARIRPQAASGVTAT